MSSAEGHDSCLPLPKRKQERVETVNEIDQESVLFCLIITHQFTFELFFDFRTSGLLNQNVK